MSLVFKVLGILLISVALAIGIVLLLNWSIGSSWGWLPFINGDLSEPKIESFVPPAPGSSGPYISHTYEWKYEQASTWPLGGTTHSFSLTLNAPQQLYDWYRGLERVPDPNYSVYVSNPSDDQFLQTVADELSRLAHEKGFNSDETLVNFVASFGQAGGAMSYQLEGAEGEYPKYPLETLADGGGDCEDTSILLAAILELMGRDVVLINFPPASDAEAGHMGVGVVGQLSGTHFSYNSKSYYYLETTNSTYRVGVMPEEYKTTSATLYALEPIPLLKFYGQYSWKTVENVVHHDRTVTLNMTVRNWGTAATEGAYVQASYDEQHWQQSDYFNLNMGDESSNIQVKVTVPQGQNEIAVHLIYNGITVDQAEVDLQKTS